MGRTGLNVPKLSPARRGRAAPGPEAPFENALRRGPPLAPPRSRGAVWRRRNRVRRAFLATLTALAAGVVAAPNPAQAIDCNDAAFTSLVLPDPADPGADGWTSTGDTLRGIPPNDPGSVPEIAAGDQNKGIAQGTVQLFTKQIGSVICLYARREFVPNGTANGVLCFDENDCSVCAWDVKTGAGDPDPKGTQLSNMLTPSSYGQDGGMDDCSACHVVGPAIPMDAMYQQLDLTDLMNECVSNGGPEWVGAPASWAMPDTNNVVPGDELPEGCGESFCHGAGLLKPQSTQTIWCDFAGQAFQEGGSMEAAGYSQEECKAFMETLMCDPELCEPPAGEIPSLSTRGLAGLTVFMIAAGCLLISRRQSPRSARSGA